MWLLVKERDYVVEFSVDDSGIYAIKAWVMDHW
jgi:hypothetical protein